MMCSNFSELRGDLNELKEQNKEVKNDFEKINYRFDSNDKKFNEIKGDINAKFEVQNSNFNDKFNEQNVKFNEIKGEINEINVKVIQQLDKLVRNIENNEVSRGENSNDIVDKVVLESKVVNIESNTGDFVEVEFRNEVLLACLLYTSRCV